MYEECGVEYVDTDEVAAEKAERERYEVHEAMSGQNRSMAYCDCGTIAIRRCTACGVDICNSAEVCCFRKQSRWICVACHDAVVAQREAAEQAEAERKRRAYNRLPQLTVEGLEAALRSGTDVQDGVTHRITAITHQDLAETYARLHGADEFVSGQVGLQDPVWTVLMPDGSLVEYRFTKVTTAQTSSYPSGYHEVCKYGKGMAAPRSLYPGGLNDLQPLTIMLQKRREATGMGHNRAQTERQRKAMADEWAAEFRRDYDEKKKQADKDPVGTAIQIFAVLALLGLVAWLVYALIA